MVLPATNTVVATVGAAGAIVSNSNVISVPSVFNFSSVVFPSSSAACTHTTYVPSLIELRSENAGVAWLNVVGCEAVESASAYLILPSSVVVSVDTTVESSNVWIKVLSPFIKEVLAITPSVTSAAFIYPSPIDAANASERDSPAFNANVSNTVSTTNAPRSSEPELDTPV